MDVTTKQYVDNNLPNVLKFYYTTTSSSDTYIPNVRLPYKVDLPSNWDNLILPSMRLAESVRYISEIDIDASSKTVSVGDGEEYNHFIKFNSNGSSQAISNGTIVNVHQIIVNFRNYEIYIDDTDGSIYYAEYGMN